MENKNKYMTYRDIIRKTASTSEFKEDDVRFIVNEFINNIIESIRSGTENIGIGSLGKIYVENHRIYGKVVKFKIYRKTKYKMLKPKKRS